MRRRIVWSVLGLVASVAAAGLAHGQTPGPLPGAISPAAPQDEPPADGAVVAPSTTKQKARKPLARPAKEIFGAVRSPSPLAARAIGFYSKGCLAGARALPIDGPAWQAMRLSRNRYWGHPNLIAMLERFAKSAQADGWPGLLVGDLSQPRGGPMLTGHASHQVGLDADIWLTPMPDRRLTAEEREQMSATSMLAAGDLAVDPKVWTPAHASLLKRAASLGDVERVLVHPAIKKALCASAEGSTDRAWLAKVRPYWGHYYHFHVRIACPKDSAGCQTQATTPADDGCGKELADWYKLLTRPVAPPAPPPPPGTPVVKPKPKPQLTLDQLPADCRAVVGAAKLATLPPIVPPAAVAEKKK